MKKPPRVLVVSVDFHGIGRSFVHALKQLGLEAWLHEFAPIKYTNNFCLRNLMRFSGRIRSTLVKRDSIKITSSLMRKIDKLNPDLILIYKGNHLLSQLIMEMKVRRPNILWACWVLDPIQVYKNSEIEALETLRLMDAVFVYDQFDLENVKSINANSYYLPAGYDSLKYYPTNNRFESRYLFSFVGSLIKYRLNLLEKIITANKLTIDQIKIIAGKWPGLFYSRIVHPNRFKSFLWQNSYISAITLDSDQVNKLYNDSDICLNLHRDDWSHCGINPRTFEIAGSGSFQICDHLSGIENMFLPEKEIVLFKTPEEASDKFRYYLEHPEERRKVAETGFKRASCEHRYIDRFRKMLEILKFNGL